MEILGERANTVNVHDFLIVFRDIRYYECLGPYQRYSDLLRTSFKKAMDQCGLRYSNTDGDKLVALWRNDELVEDDPGVSSTLTFPGTSAQKVIGIDVLHGFEQELIIEILDGNLVIRNLLIKDYPIILRLIE